MQSKHLNLILIAICAFIFTAIIGKLIIPVLKKLKVGQSERADGPRSHLRKQGTPTMGGIMIIISMVLFVTIECLMNQKMRLEILPIALASIGFGLVGFIDDFKKVVLKNTDGLSPKLKLLGQLIIASMFIVYLLNYTKIGTGIKVPFTDIIWNLPKWFYIIFMILVMLGTTNAINLTDGVDGLAGSVSSIIIGSLSVIGYRYHMIGVTAFGVLTVGSICGFLIYNFHKAKVIMGDTGSLLLGGAISAMAIYLQSPLILLIVAIIPIIETLSVILQVLSGFFRGKLLFKMAPLHHHFELSGWRENRVVAVFSAITLVAAIIGILVC
ncbi:MAG: phospho-N-acetylmuramoyl-pentapeptide-transferase [Clostridia bacterium]|nr:phospho-N-acetylmuramoyl-pentapeptide-transferase [Clostridia bacterium]